MTRLARSLAVALLVAFTGLGTSVTAQPVNTKELIILTTTTTQDSGILRVLTDAFARKSALAVKTIVAGSGDILKQGARGEGDVLLTHSPEAEKAWMAEGHGTSRRLVMYNDFVIIGPQNDPVKIKGLKAADALKRIFEAKAPFVSRGDQSGTHVRELATWKRAGIDPKGQAWYRETGQGQGLTMDVAAQFRAYAFTDRGTYLVHAKRIGLPILVEGDPALYNIYPQRGPWACAPATAADDGVQRVSGQTQRLRRLSHGAVVTVTIPGAETIEVYCPPSRSPVPGDGAEVGIPPRSLLLVPG